jgi:NAD(P)-dependent dehydrogenase (short-subunit alcohol dehydrogenase family)
LTLVRADLRGKTALVTGANSGIGLEVARGLLRLGARVLLGCRDPRRGEAARAELSQSTGNPEAELLVVDFSDRASIRRFAKAVVERASALHVLVNNAGIWSERRQVAADGIELVWATNMLGYFLTTELLLPLIRRSAPSRVVTVASELAGDLDLEDVEFRRRRYSGLSAYSQSKQANRMWTWALARRLEGAGVTANAVHPGAVDTPLLGKGGGPWSMVAPAFAKVFSRTPEQGADTPLWLAASPELQATSGRFFKDRREAPCRFRGEEGEERLYAVCERMTAG